MLSQRRHVQRFRDLLGQSTFRVVQHYFDVNWKEARKCQTSLLAIQWAKDRREIGDEVELDAIRGKEKLNETIDNYELDHSLVGARHYIYMGNKLPSKLPALEVIADRFDLLPAHALHMVQALQAIARVLLNVEYIRTSDIDSKKKSYRKLDNVIFEHSDQTYLAGTFQIDTPQYPDYIKSAYAMDHLVALLVTLAKCCPAMKQDETVLDGCKALSYYAVDALEQLQKLGGAALSHLQKDVKSMANFYKQEPVQEPREKVSGAILKVMKSVDELKGKHAYRCGIRNLVEKRLEQVEVGRIEVSRV